MTIHLNEPWVQKLRSLPESGMGYQVVDIRLRNGAALKGVLVFNGEHVEAPDSAEFSPDDIETIRVH